MIDEELHIKEMYNLKHRNDSNIEEKEYLNNFSSNYIHSNEYMHQFIQKLEIPVAWIVESNLILRNFWNYSVDKFYNKHDN